MIELPIIGGFYQSDSTPISNQQCINWRPNIPQTEGALSTGTLAGVEGLSLMVSSGLTQSANRGSHTKDGIPYHLNGETLYRQDRNLDGNGVESFVMTLIGVIPGTDRASFADNGTQMIVVAGGLGWIIDETAGTVFTAITDPAFTSEGVPQQVVFLDSFFLLTLDSKKFLRSAANNGLSWAAVDAFTAEADPDDIVAPIVLKNQLLIAGGQTIEFFQDIAGQFQRVNGQIINKGVLSPFGIANTSDSVMFIGGGVNESPGIWEINGGSARKISTTAIDIVLGRLTTEDVTTSIAYSFAKAGAFIVGFTFETRTFEYNTVTQRWNERSSKITDARGLVLNTRWRVSSVVTAYNRIICADYIDGRIGELDPDVYQEYGEPIVRTLTTAPFFNQGTSFSIPKLELTMEAGVGTATDDPQIRMSVSRDAKTFGDELWRGIGKIGEYNRRSIWFALGRFDRYAVLKFEFSENVKPTIIKLEAQVKSGYGK
jgi:hypothetical protein